MLLTFFLKTIKSPLVQMASPEDTLRMLDRLLEENPDSAAAWITKSVMHAQMGDLGEAIRCIDRAIKLNPKQPEAYALRGRLLLSIGPQKAGEALKAIQKGLQLAPDNITILKDKALALRALGEPKLELECYRLIGDSDEWQTWVRRGDVEFELNLIKDAIDSYGQAIQLEPGCVPALVHRAIALAMLEHWKEAIKSAEEAAKVSPEDAEVWRVLGDVRLKAGKHRSAMKALKKASEIDPEDASVENAMGLVEYRSGNLRDAARHFKRAIVRKRDHVSALRNLGMVYIELEEWDEAIKIWVQFTGIVKNDPDAYDALAIVAAKLNDFCEAADAWEKARKLYKKKKNEKEGERVSNLGRAARINCSRQRKALREEKKRKKSQRQFSDRFELRREKQKRER